jgi:hypothetical protein
MRDLSDARLIHLKGWSFLLIGLVAAALLLVASPSAQTAVLLGIAIWAFCRFYYYAFYVISRYVDPSFRFSGLGAFALYLLRRARARRRERPAR